MLATARILTESIYFCLEIAKAPSNLERLLSTVKLGLCLGASYTAFKIRRVLSNMGFVGSNRNMCDVISEHLPTKRKIYVMAGTAHVENPSGANQAHKQAVQVLYSYLSDKPHIILIPKSTSSSFLSSLGSTLRSFLPF